MVTEGSTTPFLRPGPSVTSFSRVTGRVAGTRAGRVTGRREARTPRKRQTTPPRRASAPDTGPPASRWRLRVPFPQPLAGRRGGSTRGPPDPPPRLHRSLGAGKRGPGKASAKRTHRPWSPSPRSGWPRPPHPRRCHWPWRRESPGRRERT